MAVVTQSGGRAAVERVNSRLQCGLTLDELTVRGKKKIALKLDLAIIVLYALALGHLRRKAKHWRSYTRVADLAAPRARDGA